MPGSSRFQSSSFTASAAAMSSADTSRPSRSRSSAVGTTPIAVSVAARVALEPAHDPLEHAGVLAVAGPQELAVLVLAEPVDAVDGRQRRLVGARRSSTASARSSRPCGSRRTGASRTGRGAARRARRTAAAVFSEPIVAATNTPWFQSRDSYTSGTVVARRPPKRNAEIGTPFGSSHSGGDRPGTATPAAQKREFGCAAGAVGLRRPVVALSSR